MTILEITKQYKNKLDYFDLELIIAHSLGKTREFVLMCPEYEIPKSQISKLRSKIARRVKGEPVAYIIGHKEFYGLDFLVNKSTLVPRPETEMIVEAVIEKISRLKSQVSSLSIIDVGTGSGCIIVSIAHTIANDTRYKIQNTKYYATDISNEALKIAKKNAKLNGVSKKITLLQGNLLRPFEKKLLQVPSKKQHCDILKSLIITANLPYLSKEIYNNAPIDVKKYEPKSALYSAKVGLDHYERLLKQIRKIFINIHKSSIIALLEISPEQKLPITKLIESIFPFAKIEFSKDLAGKSRLCKIIFLDNNV